MYLKPLLLNMFQKIRLLSARKRINLVCGQNHIGMQRDYILEIVEELGRILRTIIMMKKSNPSKALQEIRTAFKGTKFKDKDTFDSLSAEALTAYIEDNKMDYRSLDVITDLLLEEIEIRLDGAEPGNIAMLTEKTALLINITDQKEKAQKVFSLNRDVQRKRLKELQDRLPPQ